MKVVIIKGFIEINWWKKENEVITAKWELYEQNLVRKEPHMALKYFLGGKNENTSISMYPKMS